MKKILIVVLCLFAFINLLYIIPLFTMGIANERANQKEEALLSEKSIWISETGSYKLIFDDEQKYMILEDQPPQNSQLYMIFGIPGEIRIFDCKKDLPNNKHEINSNLTGAFIGYADWMYKERDGRECFIIKIHSEISTEYTIFCDQELIFYRQ